MGWIYSSSYVLYPDFPVYNPSEIIFYYFKCHFDRFILNYGNKVAAFPIGVISLALGTAVIPYFSKMVAVNDWGGINRSLRKYLPVIFLTLAPVSFLFYYFSFNIVEILFQRGSFTEANTIATSNVLGF